MAGTIMSHPMLSFESTLKHVSVSLPGGHPICGKKEVRIQRIMTSCPRPKSKSCQKDGDCMGLVQNTIDPNEATCQNGYCEHVCMNQYRGPSALAAFGSDMLGAWCGATNNGVPWGSVCVKNSDWQKGEIPIQCVLPFEGYVCPPGWSKALWNDGEASKMAACGISKENVINCYGVDDAPCCQGDVAKCGGC